MVTSRDQNARQCHNIKISNKSFERVKQFKYLETTLTNQNSIREEIKEQTELGECLLSFGEESFIFQFTVQKCKD
jgi:hypothetical protein